MNSPESGNEIKIAMLRSLINASMALFGASVAELTFPQKLSTAPHPSRN